MAADATVTVRERDHERRPARARRLPRVLARVRWPLVAILVLGAAWTIWFVAQCTQYFIQPDELEYVKQSRLIAQELHPLLPGDRYFNSWSQLQPLLLAPVWAIRDTNLAHQLMGIVNALIMVSAAIPAYLLTRRVVAGPRWPAYVVALLTVAVPWIAAAATMMTEVAAYPAFLWAVLAVHVAVARPSPRNDAIGVLGVLLAYFARPQLAVLAVALLGGLLLQELRFAADTTDPLAPRRARIAAALRAAIVRHRWLLGALGIALVVYAAVRPNLFGGYSSSGVTTSPFDAPGVWRFSRELIAYVTSGTALLPLAMALGWALLTLVRPLNREQHAFAAIAVIAGVLLTIAVGAFTARYTPQGVNSRYLFYLAPLLFIGMVALVVDRRPATWPLAIGGLIAVWIVYGSDLSQSGPSLVSPDQTFHTVLAGRTYQVGKTLGLPHLSVPHLYGAVGIALVALLVVARRSRYARASGLAALVVVTLFCAAETGYSLRKIADTQRGVSADFIDGRDWIDQAMPDGQTAQVILSTLGDPPSAYPVWWDTSFWNSSVDRSMTLPTMPDLQQPFPQMFQILDDGSFAGYTSSIGAASIGGPGLGSGPWFVRAASDRSFGFREAEVVAERFGILLLKTPSPPMAAWWLLGTADDTGRILRGAPPATLRVYPASPGARSVPVTLALGTVPGAQKGQRYEVGRRHGFVRVGKVVRVRARAMRDAEGRYALAISAPGEAAQQVPRGLQVLEVRTG